MNKWVTHPPDKGAQISYLCTFVGRVYHPFVHCIKDSPVFSRTQLFVSFMYISYQFEILAQDWYLQCVNKGLRCHSLAPSHRIRPIPWEIYLSFNLRKRTVVHLSMTQYLGKRTFYCRMISYHPHSTLDRWFSPGFSERLWYPYC